MKDLTYIYGRHAVLEAIKKRPDCIYQLWLGPDVRLENIPPKAKVTNLLTKKLPGRLPSDVVHQGYIAGIDIKKLLVDFKEFKKRLVANSREVVLVLGEVQDPHNVGAIIRSAVAFGITAILIPEHRQAPITGTVVKVSAGMVFSVKLVEVGNVNSAIRELKDVGFWVYGLDMVGDKKLSEEDFSRPTVIVVGNEGNGIRQKTRELCDIVLTIPMDSRAESLNASVSSAITMYAYSVKNPNCLIPKD